jgi:hypothetical protein
MQLLDIYLKKCKSSYNRGIYYSLAAKLRNQPRCPTTKELVKEYYSAINERKK